MRDAQIPTEYREAVNDHRARHWITTFFFATAVVVLATPFSGKAFSAENRSAPNIVFILADDLGYGDLGCYGHPVAKTPHLDRLAREGVRFTQHYANGPECSPTRTAFLTGCYQQRAGGLECAIGTGNVGRYDDAITLAERNDLGLPPDLSVLPSELKKVGYDCAIFGKWHLGYEPKFNPMEHGWDRFFGYLGGNVDYFEHHETSDLHVLYEGREQVDVEGYMTHLITDRSIEFVKQNRNKPFFLYVAHECPHFPFQGPDDRDKVVTEENWTEPDQDAYVAMLEDLDSEVGRLLDTIEGEGLSDETLVVFVSDNGGLGSVSHMQPLRGTKSTTLEGGIRVPLIVRWPGKVPSGMECDQPCATFDLTRSFLRLAGVDLDKLKLDGYDIIQHLHEERETFKRTLFWRGHRGDRTWWAVRDGDWKYVRKRDGPETQEWLYDLASDVGEQRDRLDGNSAIARQLKSKLSNWEADVTAERLNK